MHEIAVLTGDRFGSLTEDRRSSEFGDNCSTHIFLLARSYWFGQSCWGLHGQYFAVAPPSTVMLLPVIIRESSEARNTTVGT